jgi:hypothetical protein
VRPLGNLQPSVLTFNSAYARILLPAPPKFKGDLHAAHTVGVLNSGVAEHHEITEGASRTQRIQTQFWFGCDLSLWTSGVANLAVQGSSPIWKHFSMCDS